MLTAFALFVTLSAPALPTAANYSAGATHQLMTDFSAARRGGGFRGRKPNVEFAGKGKASRGGFGGGKASSGGFSGAKASRGANACVVAPGRNSCN